MERKQNMECKHLVTGDMGFVGSHLREAVGAPKGMDLNDGVDFMLKKQTEDIIAKYNPDVVYHLAAITQVVDGLESPRECFMNNIISTLNILEMARKYGFRVVLMSSDKVYGEGMDRTEKSLLNAIYPYDTSKKCCEDIAQSYYKTYGVDVVTVRSCNIYGENDPNKQRLVPGMIQAAKNGHVFNIRSNGKLLREYIYVADVVRALELVAMDGKAGEVYNISSGEVMSVLDMVGAFREETGVNLQYEVLDSADKEINRQSLDGSKLRSLGWSCKNSFRDVISRIYKMS